MTIASEITRIKTNISNAYTALEAKGATIPSEKNSANLANTVDTITGGGRDFIGLPLEVTSEGVLQKQNQPLTLNVPTATSIDNNGLSYAFYGCTSLTSVDLSNVTSINNNGLSYAFFGCTSLTSVDLSNVTSIGDSVLQYAFAGCSGLTSTGLNNVMFIRESSLRNAFQGCTSLTSTGLENVTRIDDSGLRSAFQGCTSLISTGLENVTYINGAGLQYAFQDCTSLTSAELNNVTYIPDRGLQYAFRGCTSLKSLSFPALKSDFSGSRYTSQFTNMLSGVTGCTVHFPSNLETVIGDWSSVTSGFGGTDTTVLFDLPSTETSGDGTGGG